MENHAAEHPPSKIMQQHDAPVVSVGRLAPYQEVSHALVNPPFQRCGANEQDCKDENNPQHVQSCFSLTTSKLTIRVGCRHSWPTTETKPNKSQA